MNDYLDTAGELIDKLALEVVVIEPKNLEDLGAILEHLEEVSALFRDVGKDTFADLAEGMKSIAQTLISDEHPSPEKGIKQIAGGISLFQEILRDEEDIEACSEKIVKYLGECGLLGDRIDKHKPGESKDDAVGKHTADISRDKELIENFIMESQEHLGTIEVNVLALEQDPGNLDMINAILRPFHTIKGVAGFLNLVDINVLAHEVETLLDDVGSEQLTLDETVIDLILDTVDLMNAMMDHLRQELDTGQAQEADFQLEAFLDRLRRLQVGRTTVEFKETTQPGPMADGADTGHILIEKGAVTTQDVADAIAKQSGSDKKIGQILIENEKVEAREVARALRDQKKLRAGRAPEGRKARLTAFVRVDTNKLDNLVDMVGELVITEAILDQDISGLVRENKKAHGNLTQLRRITSEIQRISMSMRMIPIKQTFRKMLRLVRDLSRKSNKLVKLETIGEDTEIDRNMVDDIYDPLVHMIRNCIDHGIETPEVRKAMGKPETGTVTLKAYHKGGDIVIEVSEDGKGLDQEGIVRKAVERDLITSDDDLPDQEIYNLICMPGFSTADKVTNVSGRGVGMDVVRRAVDKMRGKLEIQSVPGKGTTTLIKLPLTMAIIDGIIVRAGERDFIIPTASVVEFMRPERSAYNRVADRGETIKIRDSLYPLVRLHSLLGFNPMHEDPWEAIVVVAEGDGRRKCLLVDELIGKQEVVIKSLGEQLKNVKGMAGGAILADGRVGLILDVPGLFELCEGSQGFQGTSI